MEMRRDVFQAIADPNRRAIIHLLSGQQLTMNGVAENFDISRPAISRHIRILTECGLIVIRQQGRERYCEANFKALHEVSDWVSQYRTFWTAKLDALGDFLEAQASLGKPPATGKPPAAGKPSAAGKESASGKQSGKQSAPRKGKHSPAKNTQPSPKKKRNHS
jgi:DNA-binding transcriptional ArsR family regulator